ncbi:putative transcriptional repressor [Candida maltosa Xu316]|uniref:Putative transcriptional repressor n=1 Tax=Candida maltosa (strain Xu316) TaxID=1245528 RepID=M3HJ62_CANMX|nr:putative transcriptional repressor [Candida maltosa Xu316]
MAETKVGSSTEYKPKRQHTYTNRYAKQPAPPAPILSRHELLQVSTHLNSIPRLQMLDGMQWNYQPIYQNIIDQYVASNQHFITNPRLANHATRDSLVSLMRQVYGRSSILFALDIEAWEIDTNIVTEIGISIYDPRDQQVSLIPSTIQIHIRIKEYLDKTNGRYVPNHAQNFNGNASYIMTQTEAALLTQSLVDYYFVKPKRSGTSCYLVGHDLRGDVKWMNSIGVNFPDDHLSIDTNQLFRISHGKENISLKRALGTVEIPFAYLHNAGNDAYYTLLLAMKLCDPQSRVRYALDVLIASEQQKPLYTKEEKEARKEAKRQARLEAKARGEVYVPEKNLENEADQEKPARQKKKKLGKGVTCESIEVANAIEATTAIFR